MTDRDLLSQALDALESVYSRKPLRDLDETICALKSALAAPPATSGDYAIGYAEGFNDACKPAPADMVMVPREPTPEMLAAILEPIKWAGGVHAYRAMIAAAPPAAPAPGGMMMVPREPTPEMIEAADQSDKEYSLRAFGPGTVLAQSGYDHWVAMIAAAPPAAPAPAVPATFVVPGFAQWRDGSAAPVVPLTREQQIAIREAHCNTASDEYFGARPQVDDATKRRIYEAGFKEGWESAHGISTVVREPLTDEEIALAIFEARVGHSPFKRDGSTSFRIARAIERAHGIGGGGK